MLHALRFSTFGEIAALGLELHVHCPSCHATRRLSIDGQRWRDRCFAPPALPLPRRELAPRDLRWTRSGQDSAGRVLPVGGPVTLAFLYCRRCTWSIDQVQLDQPPWSAHRLASADRYRCPGCGGRIDWHIHGPTWRPTYG